MWCMLVPNKRPTFMFESTGPRLRSAAKSRGRLHFQATAVASRRLAADRNRGPVLPHPPNAPLTNRPHPLNCQHS